MQDADQLYYLLQDISVLPWNVISNDLQWLIEITTWVNNYNGFLWDVIIYPLGWEPMFAASQFILPSAHTL